MSCEHRGAVGASVSLDSTEKNDTPHGETDGGKMLLPFARELSEVATQLEQGAPPALYHRLSLYYNALRAAQAVSIAFQQQRANGDGEGR